MKRIVVVGTSGSGKTTLAKRLSKLLLYKHIELDAVYWQRNWVGLPDEVFHERISKEIQGEQWTLCGNYSRLREQVWSRADTIVWLDFSLGVIMTRLLRRTYQRVIRRELLWGNNRERVWEQLNPKESIIVWALKTFKRRRREYPVLMQEPRFQHIQFVRLHTPKEVEEWVAQL